jgi:hypothetical protein
MKYSLNYLLLVILLAFVFGVGRFEARAEEESINETLTEKEEIIEPVVGSSAQRLYCADFWNVYYEKEKSEIKVSTRGLQNEVVVFRCPDCSLEEDFVEPFLNSEYQGETGMDRIKECGFVSAIFKGRRGMEGIVKQVP